MEKEYHTLNEGIPPGRKSYENKICMDTHQDKEELNIWIGHHETIPVEGIVGQKPTKTKQVFVSQVVHLSRKDAQNLVEEITHRLF